MTPQDGSRLIRTGVIGSVIALICCLTPVLIVLLTFLGVTAVIGYLDFILLPALTIFLGLTVYGWRLRSRL
jgi:mercuric ion transport protein